MNRTLAGRIADAVLYEGYILYPYRPSVKNRQRWTFGGLYPEACCRTPGGADAAANQTECLVRGGAGTTVEVVVRFLHLTARVVGTLEPPWTVWPPGGEPPYRPVEALRVGGRLFQTWQEAEEREVEINGLKLQEMRSCPFRRAFAFPGRRWLEPLHELGGKMVGVLAREQQAVAGEIEVTAAAAGDGLYRLTVRVHNRTALADAETAARDNALLRTLVSTHVMLGARDGEFVSLLEPPEACRRAAAGCRNVGVWPVLVGEEGSKEMMLSSPVILYDYPQVAPESPGDLFDGGEIDEILTLRILTLTDEEKGAMAAVDGRAQELLARTESLAREQLSRLHGTMRGVRPVEGEGGA